MLTPNACPHDMLKFFDAEDDDLTVVEIGNDDKWAPVPPFMPRATLLVVLFQKGIRKIAVRCGERVVEFKLYDVILRDGELKGVERVVDDGSGA